MEKSRGAPVVENLLKRSVGRWTPLHALLAGRVRIRREHAVSGCRLACVERTRVAISAHLPLSSQALAACVALVVQGTQVGVVAGSPKRDIREHAPGRRIARVSGAGVVVSAGE